MEIHYKPKGVCSRGIHIELEGGRIKELEIIGGCSGNLQGICALAKGRTAEEVVGLLRGIRCGMKHTSCPDQLAVALTGAMDDEALAKGGSAMTDFDDSDMKILPDDPSEVFDTAEGAALSFAREKANGNLEKAKMLGHLFAEELTHPQQSIVHFGVGEQDDEATLAQRKALFAFVVNKVIEDMAPNSIVAQSALSSFYEVIQSRCPKTYALINDPAAFSMYILSSRSHPDDTCASGRVFARLCGHLGDRVYEKYGCELAELFSMHCTQAVLRIEMVR